MRACVRACVCVSLSHMYICRISYKIIFGGGEKKYSSQGGLGAQPPDAEGYMHIMQYLTTFITGF